MKVVPLYAALLGIVFFVLSVRTLRLRRSLNLAIGDGGNPVMLRAMRVHSNFAEYVPLCLVLLGFSELQGTSPMVLQLLGLCLLLGRLSHAYGVSQPRENFAFRISGMALTLTCLLSACATLLFQALGLLSSGAAP